ncbi:MAG: matrixin family metalloprotease [Gemmataceae bacterium]|nr:matrixin family metalloprotease [Gemmataceae bacterium]
MPATFGIPWADPRYLKISFAPDQTPVSTAKSSLFQTLNTQYPSTAAWQEQILRAAQSWASVTNIDLGMVVDTGVAFGSNPGSGTSRHAGDIRVGATPQPASSLAIGLPPDPFFADYWSGTIVYNSTNVLNPAQATLYSVFAHELGHAFGLAGSTAPGSVMNQFATTPATQLAPSDIASIQALYGARQPDQYDRIGNNNTVDHSYHIEPDHSSGTPAYVGEYPLIAFADITTNADLDFFEIKNLDNYSGPMTFTLQSRGLSLLAPKLSLVNGDGQVIAQSYSTELGGGTVSIHLNLTVPNKSYYLRVEGATADEFGIGRYAVSATFDAAVTPAALAYLPSVYAGPYIELDSEDLSELFIDPTHALFNEDGGSDDDIAMSTPLTAVQRLFAATGAIETATDVDAYRLHTATGTQPVSLTATVRAADVNGTMPAVRFVTSTGQSIPGTVLFNGDGRLTVQARSLLPNTDYIVKLSAAAPTAIGNYDLSVLQGSLVVNPMRLMSGTVDGMAQTFQLNVVQNSVFHLMLSVIAPGSLGLRMTIDGPGGRYYDLTVMGGQMANNRPVLLPKGVYTVRYQRVSATPTSLDVTTPIAFRLSGAVLSDPISPGAQDPTQNPAGPGSSLSTYFFKALSKLGFGKVDQSNG